MARARAILGPARVGAHPVRSGRGGCAVARGRRGVDRAHRKGRGRARAGRRRDARCRGRAWMSGDPRQTGEMPFLAHLEELRVMLIHVIAACAVGGILGWWLAPRVLDDLIARTVHEAVLL